MYIISVFIIIEIWKYRMSLHYSAVVGVGGDVNFETHTKHPP